MGETTKIEWADATFNPWTGCAKVSDACKNCYAEAMFKRFGRPELWRGERARTSVANWRKPLRWAPGTRVFCSSLADVFEDHPALPEWRADLWKLIESTPHLVWMLLTKRPENVRSMAPPAWLDAWPAHVWIGTTVEHQAAADARIPHLRAIPAPVRFLSCEPLLGPVGLDLRERWAGGCRGGCLGTDLHSAHDGAERCRRCRYPLGGTPSPDVSWVIAGGESGPGARPSNPDWYRQIRDDCARAEVPFHFKQWGDHDAAGKRVGKANAGRLLDGRTWDGLP